MPKVFLSSSDRAIAKFRRWYYDTKRSRNMTDEILSRKLGCSRSNVSAKMKIKGNEQTNISLKDAIIIFKEMKATDEEILSLMRQQD